MAIVYKDLAELINNAKWEVSMEDSKELFVPYYYRKYPEFKPLYTGSSGDMTISMVTIDQIVKMCNINVVFGIVKPKDVVSIYTYLLKYTETLSTLIVDLPKTHEYVRYYDKCRVAINTIENIAKHILTVERKQQIFKEQLQLTDILRLL